MIPTDLLTQAWQTYGWLGIVGILAAAYGWVAIRARHKEIDFQDTVNTAFIEDRKERMRQTQRISMLESEIMECKLLGEKLRQALHETQLKVTNLEHEKNQLRAELSILEQLRGSDNEDTAKFSPSS